MVMYMINVYGICIWYMYIMYMVMYMVYVYDKDWGSADNYKGFGLRLLNQNGWGSSRIMALKIVAPSRNGLSSISVSFFRSEGK